MAEFAELQRQQKDLEELVMRSGFQSPVGREFGVGLVLLVALATLATGAGIQWVIRRLVAAWRVTHG